ncbi:MAG: V-type ATP synthase subunit E family protein [Nitrosopumilaceae archaeon]|nr:V-type ATP synthase subunit E family protein [Nitrosopumilaceae archaeon]
MGERPPLASDSALERTIDKILGQTEKEILSNLDNSLSEAKKTLDDALPNLEQEYDKIISDGRKEADKIEKQVVGSSDLEARNKQLMLVEESVDKVFSKALNQISDADRSGDYSNLIKSMLKEATKILGTTEVQILTNSKDKEVVQSALSEFPGAQLTDTIDCLGGVKVKSKDGTMTFDNTIDARVQRLKPLIRKEIAAKFGVGN